jgi:hypothetical protein
MSDMPAVLFLDDLARVLRTSRRTLQKLRRARALPIPELPSLDKRPRWSGEVVQRFLATGTVVNMRSSMRRAG